jgi:hypothetical protein
MNVISQMPRWAQGLTQKFLDQQPLQGTQASPLSEDSFQQSFQQATGVVQLAAQDEIPGEDQAMGKPGEVRRNGATIYYQGDSSLSRGQVEAVVLGRRGGVEYITYAQSGPSGMTTLRMVNEDGWVELQGSQVQRKAGALEGYLLNGGLSVDDCEK